MMKRLLAVSFYAMFIFYVVFLLWLFFGLSAISAIDWHAPRSVNLIPFQTIWGYLSGAIPVPASWAFHNVFGNVAVFIPFGLYLQLMGGKRLRISFLWVVFASLFIEMTQFALNVGAADIDDVLLNALGGLIGILLYKLVLMLAKKQDRAKTIVTVLSLSVGLPIIVSSCLFFLKGGRFIIR